MIQAQVDNKNQVPFNKNQLRNTKINKDNNQSIIRENKSEIEES